MFALYLILIVLFIVVVGYIGKSRPTDATPGFKVSDLNLSIVQSPRGAGLFVLPLLEARRGIIIDMEENRERPLKGVVVAVSAGGLAPETGRQVEILSKVGDLVDFGKYAGLAYQFDGPDGNPVKAFIMRDSEILASQPEGTYDLTIHDGKPGLMHLAGLTCEHCPRETGEAGVNRLRDIAAGKDPDAALDAGPSLIIPAS